MKRLLLTLMLVVPNAGLLGMFKKPEQAKQSKTWSTKDHLFYAARAFAPSAISIAAAVASFYTVSKVKGSYEKLGVGAAGNVLGLIAATYTQHVISKEEQKDEVTYGKKVPYSVNSLPLQYLPAGISVVGCFGVAMQTILEQEKKINHMTNSLEADKLRSLSNNNGIITTKNDLLSQQIVELKNRNKILTDQSLLVIEVIRKIQKSAHKGTAPSKLEQMAKDCIVQFLPSTSATSATE